MTQQWDASKSRIIYHRFQPGESLNGALEDLAHSEGIREAIITSCIGSFTQLKLRNLCRRDENGPDFERHTICLLYTSPSPRDRQKSRMPSSA